MSIDAVPISLITVVIKGNPFPPLRAHFRLQTHEELSESEYFSVWSCYVAIAQIGTRELRPTSVFRIYVDLVGLLSDLTASVLARISWNHARLGSSSAAF